MIPSSIRPLTENDLPQVVQIHLNVLGYTLNSFLGADHLASMYRVMANGQGSFVGVCRMDGKPVGVVSGTVDLDKTRSQIFRSLHFRRWLTLFFQVVKQPWLIGEWQKGNIIGKPVFSEGVPIPAILTTIAVDPAYHNRGIGKSLILALEDFFRQQGVKKYHLDTLITNHNARKFYEAQGFEQIESRADSVVFIKTLQDEAIV